MPASMPRCTAPVLALSAGLALSSGNASRVLAEEVIPDGACIDLGASTLCHELRHTGTRRTMVPPADGSTGPPVVTLGFEFEGRRSCRSADGAVVMNFTLRMHGISDLVVADYPEMMAQVLPKPADRDRYVISDNVGIIVRPGAGRPVDPALLSSALGVTGGTLFHDGRFVTSTYVTVSESLAACHVRNDDGSD